MLPHRGMCAVPAAGSGRSISQAGWPGKNWTAGQYKIVPLADAPPEPIGYSNKVGGQGSEITACEQLEERDEELSAA